MGSSFATARLRLSQVRETDREDLIALERDPEVMRYLNGGRPTPIDGVDGPSTFLTPRGRENYVWAAIEARSGAFVGWFSLRPVDADRAELGYRLRRQVWGQGLASEGASALVAKGFEEMGFERIVASVMSVHTASRRVLEKAGLTYRRTALIQFTDPIPGSEAGDAEYEITRDVWEAQRAEAGGRTGRER
jgi:RimJ/RimL family protein N-acetyltransferase